MVGTHISIFCSLHKKVDNVSVVVSLLVCWVRISEMYDDDDIP